MRAPTPTVGAPDRLVTRPFVIVSAATFVFFLYVGVQVPLIPRLIEEKLGGSEFDIGLNLAAFSIAAIAARPALGSFGDRHGLRPMMVYGAMLTCSATIASAFVNDRWLLLPLRAVQGVGEAALFVGGASLINTFAPGHRRAEAASYFSVAVFGGIGIGPIIGETVVGTDGHFRNGLLVASLFAASGSVTAWFVPRHTHEAGMVDEFEDVGSAGRSSTSEPLGTPPLPLRRFHPAAVRPGLVLATALAGFTAFSAFMPEYAKQVGLSGSEWVFATYSVTCLVLRLVGAKVPERIGLARATSIALLGLAAGLVTLATVPSVAGVFIAAVLIAIGVSFNYPSLMAIAVNAVPERERIRVISTFTMFFEVGTVTGALLLGSLASLTSKRGGFGGGAVLTLAGLLVVWRVLIPWTRQLEQRRRADRRAGSTAGPRISADVGPPIG